MARYRIDYITKRDCSNAREGITGVGSRNGLAGGAWYKTEADAIACIRSGKDTFFVSVLREVEVRVAGAAPHWWLTTSPDGIRENNLLSLPCFRG